MSLPASWHALQSFSVVLGSPVRITAKQLYLHRSPRYKRTKSVSRNSKKRISISSISVCISHKILADIGIASERMISQENRPQAKLKLEQLLHSTSSVPGNRMPWSLMYTQASWITESYQKKWRTAASTLNLMECLLDISEFVFKSIGLSIALILHAMATTVLNTYLFLLQAVCCLKKSQQKRLCLRLFFEGLV